MVFSIGDQRTDITSRHVWGRVTICSFAVRSAGASGVGVGGAAGPRRDTVARKAEPNAVPGVASSELEEGGIRRAK